MIVWGNINLFDFNGRLITGKCRLALWPSPLSMDSMSLLNPLGITGNLFRMLKVFKYFISQIF